MLETAKHSLLQSLLAFQADMLSLVPGFIFAMSLPLLRESPELIVLYPVFLSIRGALGGLLSGKLSTALNVGWATPSFRRNTEYFWALLASQAPLSLIAALLFSAIALMMGGNPQDMLLFTISLSSLCTLTIPLLNSVVAFLSFRAGLNPDFVLYPVMSSVADLLVTAFFMMLTGCLLSGTIAPLYILSLMLVVLTITSIIVFWEEEAYGSTVVQGATSILLVSAIVTLTGLGLKDFVGSAPRTMVSSYTAFIDLLGDASGIVGSLATTRLAIGGIEAFRGEYEDVIGELVGVAVAYELMMILFTVISGLFVGEFMIIIILRAVRASLLALALGVTISILVALVSFNAGLDPDVYVIPLESCLSDLVMTYSLLLAG